MRPKKADTKLEVVDWYTGVGIAPENMGESFRQLTRLKLGFKNRSDTIDRIACDSCLGSDNSRMGAATCLQLVNDVSHVFLGSV